MDAVEELQLHHQEQCRLDTSADGGNFSDHEPDSSYKQQTLSQNESDTSSRAALEASELTDGTAPAPAAVGLPRQHHLTRHQLVDSNKGQAALDKLGAEDLKNADKIIRSLGQRELRSAFERVYGSATRSFNNNWLRRKLYEAVGLPRSVNKKATSNVNKARAAKRQRIEETRQRNLVAEEAAAQALTELMG